MVYRYYEFFYIIDSEIKSRYNIGIEWFWKEFNQKNFVITFIITIRRPAIIAYDQFISNPSYGSCLILRYVLKDYV
ncbi:hypothetical protein BpHYR1_047621 [Brachionus plicatilis]|uniref:Uncharacterized protein n=1 Tax=Brachionus plicatilis TaxID=10195 RepID=A0A3M7Q4Y2_BRAPC|nr:hypothetical protein BpHYR1_047621 [Brachionus plicatilis]